MFRKSSSYKKLTRIAENVMLKVGLLARQRWHEFLFVVSITSPEIKVLQKSKDIDTGCFKPELEFLKSQWGLGTEEE
jgi:hypothetical protein